MSRTLRRVVTLAAPTLVGLAVVTAPAAIAQSVDCAVYADRCEVNDVIQDREDDVVGDRNDSVVGDRNDSVVGDRNDSVVGDRNEDVSSRVDGRTTPEALPFTGGEVALLSLTGAGAVALGGALLVAARRRTAAST